MFPKFVLDQFVDTRKEHPHLLTCLSAELRRGSSGGGAVAQAGLQDVVDFESGYGFLRFRCESNQSTGAFDDFRTTLVILKFLLYMELVNKIKVL